jgi:hypothetical protein
MIINSHLLEERSELLILTSPVYLHSKNLLVKMSFNKLLKITKLVKNIRLVF